MTLPTNPPSALVCRHVGLAHDPFQHEAEPSGEHRCYLWMQRDPIDLDHQRGYCFSSEHRHCPWLQISLPCGKGIDETLGQKMGPVLGKAGEAAGRALLALCIEAARRAGPLLKAAGLWAWTNLPKGAAALGRAVRPLAGAGLRKAGQGGQALARSVSRRAGATPKALSEAPQGEELSALMALGREANRAGRRREAHLCFSRAAALDTGSEEAWLWMAATADDPQEAQSCLQRALAINPASGRGRAQVMGLARPSAEPAGPEAAEVAAPGRPTPAPFAKEPEVPDPLASGLSARALLDQGLKALDVGDEDGAHRLFAAATAADAASEPAWFWRAKTSTDLGEVITCLERVIELNPDNEKARSSLSWALERRRQDRERERAVSSPAMVPAAGTYYSEPKPVQQPGLLGFASTLYFIVGLLWTASLLYLFLDEGLARIYRGLAVLPGLRLPYLSSSVLGVPDLQLPELNLMYAVPALLALLCFVAMESLSSASRVQGLFLAFASAVSMVAAGLFVAGDIASQVLLAGSALAGLTALLGRVQYRRRVRAASAPGNPGAKGAAPLTGRAAVRSA